MIQNHSGVKFFYLLLDLLLLNLAVFIVFSLSPMYNYMDLPQKKLYYLHANISEMIAYTLYSRRNYFFTNKFSERIKMRIRRFVVLLLTLYLLAIFILPKGYPKLTILEYVSIFFIFKTAVFYVAYELLKRRYKKENFGFRTAILGSDNSSCILGSLINSNPRFGYKHVGYISDIEHYDKDVYLGHYRDLDELARRHNINMILVTNPKFFTEKKTKKLLAMCNKSGLRVRYVLMNNYWSLEIPKGSMSEDFLEIFNPQEIPLDHLSYRIQKRGFDILFSSLVILFVFSWLFPLLAIVIKLTSRGPVFFIQERTGINNKTFKCYKFRTMSVNKESDTKQAEKNDTRITPLGSFLRKSNMDELPQFLNVLLGHMSVVGPRPHMLKHTDQYSALIEHYKERHFVKPGITGWAQVNGFRGLTDELWKMEKRVEYDMNYLEKWNFLWDLRIIYLTVMGKNAYQNAL